jgi:hypothetical protein
MALLGAHPIFHVSRIRVKTAIPGNLCLKDICTSREEPHAFIFVQIFYETECSLGATFCNSICEEVCLRHVVPLLIYCTGEE